MISLVVSDLFRRLLVLHLVWRAAFPKHWLEDPDVGATSGSPLQGELLLLNLLEEVLVAVFVLVRLRTVSISRDFLRARMQRIAVHVLEVDGLNVRRVDLVFYGDLVVSGFLFRFHVSHEDFLALLALELVIEFVDNVEMHCRFWRALLQRRVRRVRGDRRGHLELTLVQHSLHNILPRLGCAFLLGACVLAQDLQLLLLFG